MSPPGLFSGPFALLEKSMDFRIQRHKVLSADIANADTPNFKAFDVMVKQSLERAQQPTDGLKLVTTHENHLSADTNDDARPAVAFLPPKPYAFRTDGNTVDVDREMGSLAQNQLMFNVSVRMISNEFKRLKDVIQGGSK